MLTIQIEQYTYDRLQRNARAFVDTPDTVITRALDALERNGDRSNLATFSETPYIYSDKNLPSLTHTKVVKASLNGKPLAQPNWNSLLDAVLVAAVGKGLSASEIRAIGGVNVINKTKTDEGFSPLEDTGISVQGQDSIRACYGALAIGRKIGVSVEVEFLWRDKEGAAHPGKSGRVSNS